MAPQLFPILGEILQSSETNGHPSQTSKYFCQNCPFHLPIHLPPIHEDCC